MLSRITSPLLLLLAAGESILTTAAPNCPPAGPTFEKPRNFKSSSAIRAALANITDVLTARDNNNSPGVLANETSYSIEIFSTAPETPTVFEWHHTAALMGQLNSTAGVRKADRDAVYRLGSLTKIFTVYTWLALDGDSKFNDPITKYVPELAAAAREHGERDDPVRYVSWEDVTVGALASQMGGIIRDCESIFLMVARWVF